VALIDAHRDRHRPRAADPHHLALFQHPQQAGLQAEGHLADLVEEQGAAVGRLEQPGVAAAARAGERAFLVAEQLRFQQRLGDRAAVHRDEGAQGGAVRALAVDGLGHQLLAAAGLALDQHGGRRARIQHHGLAQLFHGGRFAAQVVQAAPRAPRVHCRAVRARIPAGSGAPSRAHRRRPGGSMPPSTRTPPSGPLPRPGR
jgi:hypothetical protein